MTTTVYAAAAYNNEDMKMFCTNCGVQLADGTKFCTQCGKPTGTPPVPPTNQPKERHTKRNILIAGGVVVIAVTVILIFSTSRITITSESAGVVMLDGKETKYTIQAPGTITLYNWPNDSFSVSLKTDTGAVIRAVNSAWVRKGKTAKVYIFNDLLKTTEKYTDMIKSKPGNAELFIIRGLIYNARADAIWYDLKLKYGNNRGGAMADLLALFSGDADDDFAEALRLAPHNRFVKETLEWVRQEALNKDTVERYYRNGNNFASIGNYDEAIAEYNNAIWKAPNFAAAYYQRGRAYGNKGDYDRAIVDYTQALRIDPNNAAAKENLEGARKVRGY